MSGLGSCGAEESTSEVQRLIDSKLKITAAITLSFYLYCLLSSHDLSRHRVCTWMDRYRLAMKRGERSLWSRWRNIILSRHTSRNTCWTRSGRWSTPGPTSSLGTDCNDSFANIKPLNVQAHPVCVNLKDVDHGTLLTAAARINGRGGSSLCREGTFKEKPEAQ